MVALGALGGCRAADQTPVAPRPPLVEAVPARLGSLPQNETVYGVVRAENQVMVRSELSAPIAEVLVRSGDAVAAGQTLVRLEDDELRERLRQAEADVRLAEAGAAEADARAAELVARLRRSQALATEELISAQELETLEAQLTAGRASAEAALARVDQARAIADERRSALAKTLVRSPVAGRVGERNAEVGMLASPSSVLFRVGNFARVIVEVPLSQEMLGHVEAGQPVRILPRGAGESPIEATLSRISPFLDRESFTTLGEIDADNADGRLRPGMFVTVRILYGGSEEAALVPVSAIWEDPRSGQRGVFAVASSAGLVEPAVGVGENSSAGYPVSFRSVELLAEGEGRAGVTGVEAGEWVVITGQHLLQRALLDGSDTVAGGSVEARIRPISWQRVLALQGLQRDDLLEGFLDKQQRLARALGAEIPESEDVVQRILSEPAEEPQPAAATPTEGTGG